MAEIGQKKLHAIIIPVPYQGHITPFVNLALKLASKGFTITFAHLEFIHRRLSKALDGKTSEIDIFTKARESGLDIRYTTIGDGLPTEFDRDNFEEYWGRMCSEFPAIADDFIGKLVGSDPNLLPFIISDTVYPWPQTIADKYNLIHVSFWTQPALVFSLTYHFDLLKQNGHLPCKDDVEEEINYVPGVESIKTRDMIAFLKESGSSSVAHKTQLLAFHRVKKADFILHNTVHELESEALSALNKYQPNYAIGPINFSKMALDNETVSKSSLRAESDCALWLDSKPSGSVLYVSFGSIVLTTKHVIQELAYGLLLSGVDFIWVVRAGLLGSNGDADVLPTGYEDEIKDKGLIVPWCDQIKVLSNPAVGGFLTHNGWNSTVEGIWCGVPMICYPIGFEQPTNRKLVVDDWKIGINLCDGTCIDRNEVAEKIRRIMSEDGSMSLRKEMEKMKAKMHKAVESDGSSERNMDQFVKDLKAKIHGIRV